MEHVDGSGRHAEAISPPTSPPTRYTSPLSEMIENTPPIAMEHHPTSPQPSNDKKFPPSSPTDYSNLEAVEPYPPQYAYGGPPPGSPPPQHAFSPMQQHMSFNEKGEPIAHDQAVGTHSTDEPKVFGMRRRAFYLMLFGIIALLILAIALGVGLGVGLKKNKGGNQIIQDPFCKNAPELCIGGNLDSQYYSTKGAFNGTGIAIAGETWNKNGRHIFTLYFQHHSGDIRYLQYTGDRQWIGGSKTEVVAQDAKNGTAISTVLFTINETSYQHVFYITNENKLKQMTQDNVTLSWSSGPLTNMNLAVYDNPTVGLQACWKGNFYGDSDFSKFPTATGEVNTVPFDEGLGINIWFPSDDSTFQQYIWYQGADTWMKSPSWQGKNTHAGVGCYSWGTGTSLYTMMVNKDNDTEIWWKDTNTNLSSTDAHPINSWANTTNAAIDGVYPSTSLGYTTYFYAQMADRSIKGFNISYMAENTTIEDDSFAITNPAGPVLGLGGTHLTCTAYAQQQTVNNQTTNLWDSLYVFYQTEGDDITAFTRPIAGGEWSQGSLKIPDE